MWGPRVFRDYMSVWSQILAHALDIAAFLNYEISLFSFFFHVSYSEDVKHWIFVISLIWTFPSFIVRLNFHLIWLEYFLHIFLSSLYSFCSLREGQTPVGKLFVFVAYSLGRKPDWSYMCPIALCFYWGSFFSQSVQVKKIVTGQFDLFHSMYKPFLEEYEAKKLLRLSSTANNQIHATQVFIIWYWFLGALQFMISLPTYFQFRMMN